MRVGLRMVREGQAAGFVTAGNTGAAMATAKMVLGAVPGVDRPALAAVFPTAPGNPAMLLDVGANVDCNAAESRTIRSDGRRLFPRHVWQATRRRRDRALACSRSAKKKPRATI